MNGDFSAYNYVALKGSEPRCNSLPSPRLCPPPRRRRSSPPDLRQPPANGARAHPGPPPRFPTVLVLKRGSPAGKSPNFHGARLGLAVDEADGSFQCQRRRRVLRLTRSCRLLLPARRRSSDSRSGPDIPEDVYFLIKRAVVIRKHLERNRKDDDSKFRLILVESRIHRLARCYKRTKKLPPTWK